ncbi:unnamed protein product [Clonostachys solani]|uniref:Uncharacterized protein n=1 Tax=Clonostachys solani TaxID=160281 RepID=A0A9N9ZGG0_9HYPO|nr:unnamed protein product [Clonostachys solani]
MANAAYIRLDLPDEATQLFSKVQSDIHATTPTKKINRGLDVYLYGSPDSCTEFSRIVAREKANDIKALLADAQLKPSKAQSSRPSVYGLDRGGFHTEPGYIGMGVLVSTTTPISIISKQGTQHLNWKTGECLLIMGGTKVDFEEEEGNRFLYYFTMIPVEYI